MSITSQPWRIRGFGKLLAYTFIWSVANVGGFLISRSSGHGESFHDRFILCAVGVNVACAGLVLLFACAGEWINRFSLTVCYDLLTSLTMFGLVGWMNRRAPAAAKDAFGVIYVLFIFSKAFLLSWYALANAAHGAGKWVLTWVFAVSLLIYGAISPWVALNAWPDADEPHYLLLTHSLVADHDFDLSNNYRRQDYKSYYPPDLPDHHSLINSRGQEFPIHDIGVSIFLVPGYAVGGRLGAMVELNIIGALLALGIYVVARSIGAPQRSALVTWFLFAFTSPLVVYSSQLYPEVVGAACAVWAVVAFERFASERQPKFLILMGVLLGLLPWFSVRYWMVVGPMLTVVALYILADTRRESKLPAIKRLVCVTAPVFLSTGLFVLFDLRYYNTAMPNGGYFVYMKAVRPPMFSPHLDVGLLGLFFDRGYGLLTTAPVYILALAGVWAVLKRRPWVAGIILLPSMIYTLFAGCNLFWYGGWAPPSRYVFLAAALMVPFASFVVSSPAFTWVSGVTGAWSLFVSTMFSAFPTVRYTLWTVNTGALSQFINKHFGIDYGVIFPSFIRAGLIDYALTVAWAGVVILCVWLLNHARHKISEEC